VLMSLMASDVSDLFMLRLMQEMMNAE